MESYRITTCRTEKYPTVHCVISNGYNADAITLITVAFVTLFQIQKKRKYSAGKNVNFQSTSSNINSVTSYLSIAIIS